MDGFALGVPVYFAKLPKHHTWFALIFCALMTPIGIAIGMAVTSALDGPGALLARAVILSMSTGSFFFISLVELLPSGLHSGGWTITKLVALFFGWGIMALLALYV